MPELSDIYSENILIKAKRLFLKDEGVYQDTEHMDVFWAQGSGSKAYRIQVTEPGLDEDGEPYLLDGFPWLTCSCPNGMARGGRPTCYHSAAVLMKIGPTRTTE